MDLIQGGHTFSEDHFLGKSQNEQTVKQTQIKHKPKIQSKREVADSPSASERLAPASQCSSSSSGSAVACERRPCVQVVEKPIKITGQTKARRTHSSREASLAGNACSPGSDAEQSVGIAPVSDARSEPWLIESPTRSLPSSSGGSVSRSRSKATTAILDVRGLTWGRMLDDAGTASAGIKALATADGCPNSLAQDSQAATRDDDRCSSLGPSESASQVPVRSWIQPFLEPSVSKYFSEHVPKSQHAVPEQTERREHQTLDGHRDRGRTDWDAPRQHTPEQDIQRRLAPSLYAAHDASESFTLGNDGFKRTPLDGRTQNHRRSPSPEIIDLIPYSAQDSLLASLHGVQQDTLEEVQASDFDSYLYDGHDTHCDSRQLHDLQEGEGDLSEAGDDTAQDRWDAQDYTYASTWSDGIDYLPAEPSLVDMDVAQDAEDFESTYAMETEASQVELVEALQYERGLYDDVLHDSSDGFREGESVADDTDGDETTSGEEAWQPQGDLLLSRRGGRGHARSQPRTVHGVEIDVARAMNARAHWHPQKL
ncbi:hypothetical protein FA95DRAFT_844974 [Auriscalpium vulgare]|uniref:Uncharacterized protein n=1 Tax=Auriscalpium vulgare TaxID=40419 RepID=A0ACB8S0F5_9AGAM|nr:hypothetical protein FA95DRAFT_844974 [Auriscalpium vulgare]